MTRVFNGIRGLSTVKRRQQYRVSDIAKEVERIFRATPDAELSQKDVRLRLDRYPQTTLSRAMRNMQNDGIIKKVGNKGRREYTYALSNKRTTVSYDEDAKRVLEYVEQHRGERYALKDMGEALGLPNNGRVYQLVYHLNKAGKLPRDFNLGTETPVEETAQPAPVSTREAMDPSVPEPDDFCVKVDYLAWTYIKETGDAGLVGFVQWLQKRNK